MVDRGTAVSAHYFWSVTMLEAVQRTSSSFPPCLRQYRRIRTQRGIRIDRYSPTGPIVLARWRRDCRRENSILTEGSPPDKVYSKLEITFRESEHWMNTAFSDHSAAGASSDARHGSGLL
jgi:hypothetical protein